MNIQLGNGFGNQIQKTYLVGKYSKTLFERDSNSSTLITPKLRNGIIITISDKAKEAFAKAQLTKYNHNSPVFSKNKTAKTIYEKVNASDKFSEATKNRNRRKTEENKLSDFYDNLTFDLEKGGFVVSGNIFTEEKQTEKSAAEKLLEVFEIETQKALGTLVNVVV